MPSGFKILVLMLFIASTLLTGIFSTASFAASYTWGTAALIETDNAGNAFAPQVAVDSSGNAIAVWYQWDGTRYSIWANRYTSGSGWGTAALIETDNAGGASSPQVAFDSSGNAIAVWTQHDGTRYNIWANRMTAAVRNDFNNDGKADILWRNTSGANYIWLMNGTATAGGGNPGSVNTNWQVMP